MSLQKPDFLNSGHTLEKNSYFTKKRREKTKIVEPEHALIPPEKNNDITTRFSKDPIHPRVAFFSLRETNKCLLLLIIFRRLDI